MKRVDVLWSRSMCFYLGTHQPGWLKKTSVPLFVSRRRFFDRAKTPPRKPRKPGARRWPRACGRWALDSGAFSEIKDFGRWTFGAKQYAEDVRTISKEVGNMDWAAIQDWMCEPPMLVRTGKSIAEHQSLTIRSFLELSDLAPEIRWVPVLQGWTKDDYLRHLDQYAAAGIYLDRAPLVGLGSVCRRQSTDEFVAIVRALVANGLTLHGFGVKTHGLSRAASLLQSSDSLSWSFTARRLQRPVLDACVAAGRHKNCANCLPYALLWRDKLLAGLPPEWAGSRHDANDVGSHDLSSSGLT